MGSVTFTAIVNLFYLCLDLLKGLPVRLASNISDSELSLFLKEGSKEAFNLLYKRYGTKIYRFACGYLRCGHDAEELVQDVFLKLWDKRSALDERGNLKAFVYKMAINSIYDFIRHKNIEQAFLEFASRGTGFSESTWDEVVFNDMLSQLDQLLDKMPEQRRKIFIMSKKEGLSNEEIAVKLNLSKRTVENQLYRATLYLKENFYRDSLFPILFFYLFI